MPWILLVSLLSLALGQTPTPPLGRGLVIADAGNHRLVELDGWGRFVRALVLPPPFRYTDDVFFAPGEAAVYVTDPEADLVGKVTYPEGRPLWTYGRPFKPGPEALDNPDDLVPLPSGLLALADIRNCRVLLFSPQGRLVRTLGKTRVCRNRDGFFNKPNGAFPLGKDRLIVTEIQGHDLAITDLYGRRLKTLPLPLHYPSDANLTPWGTILVVDWWRPGAVVELDLQGRILWRYAPKDPAHRLDHPSVALGLPNGLVALTDDWRHRVLVLDRKTNRVVLQYGQTDRPGSGVGQLRFPDGMDRVP
ncbi:MAG: hypothetical protein C4301_02050 [Thermus sp.]|uniref:hypothetical protein n=1 Tax=Thermus sp. TaxID=275 RepID=UPI003323E28B